MNQTTKKILYQLTKITGTSGTSGYLVLDVRQAAADLGGGLRWSLSPKHWEYTLDSAIAAQVQICATPTHRLPVRRLVSPELSEPGSTKFRQDPTINYRTFFLF